MAALGLVGGRPGGAERPQGEARRVAAALQELHTLESGKSGQYGFPALTNYLNHVVLPRIRRWRAPDLGSWRSLVAAVLPQDRELREDPGRSTILHADLYRKNVPFSQLGHPRLIDPLPMLGDAAFDWAFWIVYYDLASGTELRLATAARVSGIPVAAVQPWCRLLALDGLLFYIETADP